MMNRPVAFMDAFRIEPRLLKLSVHIARENTHPIGHALSPALERSKTCMRGYLAIERQTMAIKPPGQLGRTPKRVRAGNVLKIHTRLAQRRISPPKPALAPEVRQAGIHAHAGTGGNDECIRLLYQRCCLLQRRPLRRHQRITHPPTLARRGKNRRYRHSEGSSHLRQNYATS